MILLFCTFPLRIPKIAFPDPFGTPKIPQNRARNAPRSPQVAPRWRPNRPLDPQDGRPGEPRALQTAFRASKMTLGTSKLEAKWVPGGQNRGLEGPITSKIGSWTVWKAVWRPRGSSGRPSWGSKGRFGRHLGATWAPREAFRERFWKILGSQTGPERRFFGSGVEKCKMAKSFVLRCVFNGF